MDFYSIKHRTLKNGNIEIYPDFKVCMSKDLMVRGKSFYAVWNEEKGMWSRDEYDVQNIVDKSILEYRSTLRQSTEDNISMKLMSNFSSGSWSSYKYYITHLGDNYVDLDTKITFINSEPNRKDYRSKKTEYSLEPGQMAAYEELISTLYIPEEREKLEWSIGSVLAGDGHAIQKFVVLYGEAGSGKSTIINIIQQLFKGYYTTFNAKALTSGKNDFATEVFKSNPIVAIQHDGDLSKIEDNTVLNSLISHEEMSMNEKHKPMYTGRNNAFLFLGSNKPVKITDAKSGIIRRLIDVSPSGIKLPPDRFHHLADNIKFEIGAIAHHCFQVYKQLGRHYYNDYVPLSMIFETDMFFNFVESNFYIFQEQDGCTLTHAYDLYKQYCDESKIDYRLPKYRFREELKSYFKSFRDRTKIDNTYVRSYYSGFLVNKFKKAILHNVDNLPPFLTLTESTSKLDYICKQNKAQYANKEGNPSFKWDNVTTTLENIKTTSLHWLKPNTNHIVIDFDLKNESGEKDLLLNLKAASSFEPTYVEVSKSGSGLHLHYIWKGDVELLEKEVEPGIEIKTFLGHSSLRRKLSDCNNYEISEISSGLPVKGEKKMVNVQTVNNENHLRNMIIKNIKKEIHPNTRPSMDFIAKLLQEAHDSGVEYDVSDMRNAVLNFAMNSSNQSDYCLKLFKNLKFQSEEKIHIVDVVSKIDETYLTFFDCEVFPNLFLVCYAINDGEPIKLFNPGPKEMEPLLKQLLIGFNNRRYDNHMCYGAYLGYNNEQLFQLSQNIINKKPNAFFSEAYNLSYTDVYDFSNKKQSLKKFQIELGLHHVELGFKWDKPLPEKYWDIVADYCCNDVRTTRAVFYARKQDWIGRKILAKLSKLPVNQTTQNHTAQIVFGNDKNPQSEFNYPDLSKEFPGYEYKLGKSTYRGIEVGEGGMVLAVPGMYWNAPVLDIQSMHPTTIEILQLFGKYTKNYTNLVNARLCIKHNEIEQLKQMFNGELDEYLQDTSDIDALSYALKIPINIVYGLTAAKFTNRFKDPRNVDNVVAKRGALFMVDLYYKAKELNYNIFHIKTDSVKIENASQDCINFVYDFGKQYGYIFDYNPNKDLYEKICLINDAVYIAKTAHGWSPTGAQFAHPVVLKSLFTKEEILFKDYCETKSASTALYFHDFEDQNKEPQFIGKVTSVVPVISGGFDLVRETGNENTPYHFVGGTKGYKWMDAAVAEELIEQQKSTELIDMSYYEKLINDARKNIEQFGDFEQFTA